jgi:two-component system response regulator (stage 0 sporulation protein F)
MHKILIIDDNETVRGFLRELLRREHYDVQVAKDGREGLKTFREQRPDVVIIDVFMPEKDGLETLIELQKEFPDAKVIAMSGYGGGSVHLKTAALLGAKRILSKPVSNKEVLEAVKELLPSDKPAN